MSAYSRTRVRSLARVRNLGNTVSFSSRSNETIPDSRATSLSRINYHIFYKHMAENGTRWPRQTNFWNIGQQGRYLHCQLCVRGMVLTGVRRKTGITVEDTGKRDAHGFEDMDNFFSPDKLPPPPAPKPVPAAGGGIFRSRPAVPSSLNIEQTATEESMAIAESMAFLSLASGGCGVLISSRQRCRAHDCARASDATAIITTLRFAVAGKIYGFGIPQTRDFDWTQELAYATAG